MGQRQLSSRICSTEPTSMQKDSSAGKILHSNPSTKPPLCITALYAENDQAIKEKCSLVISCVPHTFISIAVTSNLWIIPSKPPHTRISYIHILP